MTVEVTPALQTAIEALMKTETMEEAYLLLAQCPELLTDQADLLLSSIIHKARQQGHENTVMALDERRDFLREVRQEQEDLRDQKKQ